MRTIDVPKIEFPKIDLPKVDFSKIEFPKIDLSKVEFPKVEFPKVEFPKIDLPQVDLPDFPTLDLDDLDEKVTGLAKDAVYITIGFGVLALQKTQVRRREVVSALGDRFDTTRDQVEEMVKTVEKQVRDLARRAA
jgi:hypothetical protein